MDWYNVQFNTEVCGKVVNNCRSSVNCECCSISILGLLAGIKMARHFSGDTLILLQRCQSLIWPPVSGGRWPFRAGSGGRHLAHRPYRPRLKLQTQSHMADDHILKFDILKFQFKAKFMVVHLQRAAWLYTRHMRSQFLHHTCQSNAH